MMGEVEGGPFSLPVPRDFRGRVSSAIPSPGIVLPAAKNGQSPITYAVTNLPSGLAFNAATRAVTGNPTNAHATRAVVLTATDASTPAVVLTATFGFPVVGSSAAITRDDFDFRGYGLSSRTIYLLALIQSTVTVSGSNVVVFRRPPRTGAEAGTLLDDAGNTLTDLSGMTITAAGESVLVDQIEFQIGTDRVEFRESTAAHFGTYIGTTLGAPTLYMRIGTAENEINYERGFSNNASWRRTTPDLGVFLQGFDSGVRLLLAVSSP